MAPRRPLIAKARQEKLVAALEKGVSRKGACARANLGRRSFYEWMAKGEPDESGEYPDDEYGVFARAVDEAEASFEESMVQAVVKAAGSGEPGTWQAAMRVLEAKNPEWVRTERQQIEVTGKDGGPVEVAEIARERLMEGVERLADGS